MTPGTAADMIALDLAGLAAAEGSVTAKVLADTGAARVVLVMLRAGAEVAEQAAPSQVMIQGLRGRVIVHGGRAEQALAEGTLVLIEERVPHRLTAVDDAVLLLTYTPSPAHAGADTTAWADIPAYILRRQGPPRGPRSLPIVRRNRPPAPR